MQIHPRLQRLLGVGARFLTVGALSTVIEIAAFNVLAYAFGWNVVAAKVVASLIALVNAYFGNRQWAFRGRSRRRRWVEISLFLVVNLGCTALGALLVWLGVLGFEAVTGSAAGPFATNAVNLVSIVVVVMVRFVFYHKVVFIDTEPRAEQ